MGLITAEVIVTYHSGVLDTLVCSEKIFYKGVFISPNPVLRCILQLKSSFWYKITSIPRYTTQRKIIFRFEESLFASSFTGGPARFVIAALGDVARGQTIRISGTRYHVNTGWDGINAHW